MTTGYKFTRVIPFGGTGFELEFEYDELMPKTLMDYSNGDIRVDPKELYNNQGLIHTRVKEFRINLTNQNS